MTSVFVVDKPSEIVTDATIDTVTEVSDKFEGSTSEDSAEDNSFIDPSLVLIDDAGD